MTPPWVASLFPDGRPLVYASTLAGKRYATQWTVYRGVGEDGLHELEFLAEIDPAAAGAGGSVVRQRSRVWCTDALDPVRCTSQVQGTWLTLHFEPESVFVELPDRSTKTIPRAGAQFVADGNLPGQTALIYAELSRRGLLEGPASVRVFLAAQLVTVPYETTPANDLNVDDDRWYRTSHHEEVMLDARGVMREARVPKLGIESDLELPGAPLPVWPEDLTPDAAPLYYAPPESASFRLENVTIPGPVTPIGATLSIPGGEGPFPGVLFVSGSGTHDRHGISGEIDTGTHELMDDLAEHGFVGLRFDTRGAGTTYLGSDTLDRGMVSDIADARACLEFLRARTETAGRPLFLIGHSQGGTVALALAGEEGAAESPGGVVLMAVHGRDIDEVIADQILAQGETVGLTRDQIDRQIEDIKEAARLARSGRPWEPGEIPDYLLAMFRTRTWYEEFLRFSTPELITRVRCPVLVCQGGKDFQVSAERDAEPLVAAARAAGVDCTYALFPDLDHLFKRSAGPSTLAEYFEPRPVDAEFIARVRAWLGERAGVSV